MNWKRVVGAGERWRSLSAQVAEVLLEGSSFSRGVG